ncbi:MFS transporter [Streptomyces buecherae]|uniref:MFS transporter n=1 Tax=Streptomyces buecherae TaxID=2763006 RepID=UPI0036AA9357
MARATSSAGFFAVVPFLGLWLVDDKGLSGSAAGLVVGGAILANRAGGVILVPLIHAVGQKSSIAAGYVGAALAFGTLGMGLRLPAYGWAALAALAGLALAMATTAMKAQISTLPPDQRLRCFGYLSMAVNAGAAAGPFLGGLILEWRADALPLTAAVLYVVALVAVPALPGAWREAARARRSEKARLLPERPFVVFALLVCGTWIAYAQLFTVLPAYVDGVIGTGDLGLVFTVNAVLVLALQVPASALARKVLARPRGGFGALCLAANVLLAGAAALCAFGRSVGLGAVVAAIIVFTLSEVIWGPLYDSEVGERRGRLSSTAAYAVSGLVWGAAESAGAWVGMILAVRHGGDEELFGGLAAVPFWGAAALALCTGLALSWDGWERSDGGALQRAGKEGS